MSNVENRFALVKLAVKRTKQLYAGADPLVKCDNREIITSLREIAADVVKSAEPAVGKEKNKSSKLIPVTLRDPDDY